MFSQLYLTGAVYSLDGSDSLKETMQTSIAAADKVTAECTVVTFMRYKKKKASQRVRDRVEHVIITTHQT